MRSCDCPFTANRRMNGPSWPNGLSRSKFTRTTFAGSFRCHASSNLLVTVTRGSRDAHFLFYFETATFTDRTS